MCLKDVSRKFKGVSRMIVGFSKRPLRVFKRCSKGVSRQFQRCFKEVSREFIKESAKWGSRKFHKKVSRVFQDYFNEVLCCNFVVA